MSYYTTGNRVPGTTLIEKQENILRFENHLYFKDFTLPETDDNVQDFIYNIMILYKDKYTTISINNGAILTSAGRHRSLIDLFLLCRTYFPTCTLEEVIIGLYYLDSIGLLGSRICSTIYRRVYECKLKYPSYSNSDTGSNDELGYNCEFYKNIFKNSLKTN